MIPTTLNIGGKTYEVAIQPMAEHGDTHPASFVPRYSRIIIDSALDDQMKYSCLWHEILEAINWTYELGLEHRVITTLESAIMQVLKDNKGLA